MKPIFFFTFYFFLFTSLSLSQTTQWRLIWDKNFEDDMAYYRIFRSESPNASTQLDTVNHKPRSGNDTTMIYINRGLDKGIRYYYRLKAVNQSGLESDFSEEVSAAIPQILISDQIIYKNQNFRPIILDNTAVRDPDNNPSEIVWQISWRSNPNNKLTFDRQNNTLTIIRTDTSWIGTGELTFTATDIDSFFDIKNVLFTVRDESQPANEPPVVFGIPDQTIKAGQTFNSINLDDYVFDSDNNDDALTWTYSGNTQLTVNISASRVATITPPNSNWTGTENIIFTATDPGGLSDSDTAKFTIESDSMQTLDQVLAYPIPFRPNEDGVTAITFSNLPLNGKILIYDFYGNPVFSVTSSSSTYLWDIRNQSGRQISSGVYPYIIKDASGKKIHSGKLIVVR